MMHLHTTYTVDCMPVMEPTELCQVVRPTLHLKQTNFAVLCNNKSWSGLITYLNLQDYLDISVSRPPLVGSQERSANKTSYASTPPHRTWEMGIRWILRLMSCGPSSDVASNSCGVVYNPRVRLQLVAKETCKLRTYHRDSLARTRVLCIMVGVLAILACPCLGNKCPELALNVLANVETATNLDCKNFLEETLGISNMIMTNEDSSLPACMDVVSNRANLRPQNVVDCICPSGFTDALAGSSDFNFGILTQIEHADIQYITCAQECPKSYQNVMKSIDVAVCGCLNSRGCLFEQRTLLSGISEMQVYDDISSTNKSDITRTSPLKTLQSVLILPDDLRMDSSVVHCEQLAYRQQISPRDVIVCSFNHIEYVYRNECPSGKS